MDANGHRRGHERVINLDIVRSRAAQAGRIPGVLDAIVALRKQEDAILDAVGVVVGRHDARQHVPFAAIHSGRKRPAAAQHISAIDLSGAAGGEDEGRSNQRIGALAPNRILRALIEHREHPVMAGEVGKGPGHGGIALPDRVGAVDQCDIIEFRAADAFRLHDPEQAAFVQFAFGLLGKAAQLFRTRCTLAQPRRQRCGARNHRCVDTAVGIRTRGRACICLQTGSCHLAVLPNAPATRYTPDLLYASVRRSVVRFECRLTNRRFDGCLSSDH